MDATECREAYEAVFRDRTYRGRLDSMLSPDESSDLQDAYLASLPRDKCARSHRYRSHGTGCPSFVVCSCGGELWGRNDTSTLNFAALMGHTLLHYGAELGCGTCMKTGIVCMFRAWLLSASEDRGLVGAACSAACECVSRQHILAEEQNKVTRDILSDCPGPCRQGALAWLYGMEPIGEPLNILEGVTGELNGSLRDGLSCLCNTPGAYLPPEYATLDPYLKGLTTFYYFTIGFGQGQDTGLAAPILRWVMTKEMPSQFNHPGDHQTCESIGSRFATWAGPALDNVLLERTKPNRPVRRSLALSLDAYVRERLVEGAWLAMFAAADTTMADNWYLSRKSLGLHEYAIDSVCAFDVFTHPRALKEDALYGAGDYERKYRNLAHGTRPSPLDAYQEVIFGAAYAALASFVWGSKVHWDLLRGQHSQPPLTNHWYARVWHDALLGWSIPGPWYEQIIDGKNMGGATGDERFTNCEQGCNCTTRYHKYGLGGTLAWTRKVWCGLPCSVTPSDMRTFGSLVDCLRAILRCGEGKHDSPPPRVASAVLPVRKACIGGLPQVRCQIMHLLVWCAIDAQSNAPRPYPKLGNVPVMRKHG